MSTVGSNEVFLFAFEYPPVSGGISRLCAGIGHTLAKRRAHAHVLTQEGKNAGPDSDLPNTRVDARRPLREWRAFQWLRETNRGQATGQTAVCGIWYPEGLITYLAGVRPLVILAHGAELLPPLDRWRRPLWSLLQRRVLESAGLVIANSEYTRQLVAASAPKARVEVIPPAVDTERFATGNRAKAKRRFDVAGKVVLSTVARIHHYKAHDTILRALAQLPEAERENMVYLIVGSGPHEADLRALAAELGLDRYLRWLGFVPEQDLAQVYWASDLFVLCTRDAPAERSVEGFGLVFLEAQACGTPVVGSRTGGIPSAIREGEGGWLIEPDDSDALCGIFRRLVRSPESFRKAGQKARRRILRESTWQHYGERFTSALESAGIDNA
jgi:phosphatidylinositol alpha-1,6-mannosyltransferase